MDKQNAELAFKGLSVVGTVANAIDGTSRLLCDVERFGLRISALQLQADDGAHAKISMTILVPADSDPHQLLSRLMRHTAVLSLALEDAALS